MVAITISVMELINNVDSFANEQNFIADVAADKFRCICRIQYIFRVPA